MKSLPFFCRPIAGMCLIDVLLVLFDNLVNPLRLFSVYGMQQWKENEKCRGEELASSLEINPSNDRRMGSIFPDIQLHGRARARSQIMIPIHVGAMREVPP
jgi:hypothetical protein